MSAEKPRIWTVLGFFGLGLSAQVTIGVVLGLIAIIWLGFEDGLPGAEEITAFTTNPAFFLVSLVSVQLILLALLGK